MGKNDVAWQRKTRGKAKDKGKGGVASTTGKTSTVPSGSAGQKGRGKGKTYAVPDSDDEQFDDIVMGCQRRHEGPDLHSDDSWAEVGMVRRLNSDDSGYVAIFEDGHRPKESIEATEKIIMPESKN